MLNHFDFFLGTASEQKVVSFRFSLRYDISLPNQPVQWDIYEEIYYQYQKDLKTRFSNYLGKKLGL